MFQIKTNTQSWPKKLPVPDLPMHTTFPLDPIMCDYSSESLTLKLGIFWRTFTSFSADPKFKHCEIT